MTKNSIGIICIITGLAYGSLAWQPINDRTLGFLLKYKWIKPAIADKVDEDFLGPKPTIIFYSLILIVLGIYMLFAPSN